MAASRLPKHCCPLWAWEAAGLSCRGSFDEERLACFWVFRNFSNETRCAVSREQMTERQRSKSDQLAACRSIAALPMRDGKLVARAGPDAKSNDPASTSQFWRVLSSAGEY
eukprot:scaffold88883_cov60-Phaeocystis_antarctica.AAC.1